MDPQRVLELCLNDVTGTALTSQARLIVHVDQYDGSGNRSYSTPLEHAWRQGTAECPRLAEVSLEDQFGEDGPNARYSVSVTGPFTNHPYRNQALPLAEKSRAIDVFDRPLPAQELKLRSYSMGFRLLAVVGAGLVSGALVNEIHNTEGGAALHADLQWVPRKQPIFSLGLLYGLEMVRTNDWIERAPDQFERQRHWRTRLLLGPRFEFSGLAPKRSREDGKPRRLYRIEFHAAWAPEARLRSRDFRFATGLVGYGLAFDLSRRIPWLSFYLGNDVLFGSRSRLLRFEDTGNFSRHALRSPKLRVLAGIAWHGFAQYYSTRRLRRRSR